MYVIISRHMNIYFNLCLLCTTVEATLWDCLLFSSYVWTKENQMQRFAQICTHLLQLIESYLVSLNIINIQTHKRTNWHWTKKWICSNLPMSKDVVNMIANLKQMWWRPYLLTFVSKYGLHHVYPLVNIIFDTYLLICKDEQIHFFMQCGEWNTLVDVFFFFFFLNWHFSCESYSKISPCGEIPKHAGGNVRAPRHLQTMTLLIYGSQ